MVPVRRSIRPIRTGWLEPLLTPAPSLVVFDGVNEGMSLHGDEIKDADGVSAFRRKLIRPCVSVGAATLACDHTRTAAASPNMGRFTKAML